MQIPHYIIGIESSCDETGIAIYHKNAGLVSDVLYSQSQLHAEYGGVVPELAARDHARRIIPLMQQALLEANIGLKDLEAIAYCAGPGLGGALLVGASVGRTLGWLLKRPALGIHHLEAHLLSPLLEKGTDITFPFIALLVSGGHTLLARVTEVGQYTILGETLDDAAGEAFDKTAKLLGLPYPGGPGLAQLALKGDPSRFKFPRPLCNQANLDFSFSGLKTAVSRCWARIEEDDTEKAHIARAFEEAVIDVLSIKSLRALEENNLKKLVIAGGVSANQRLRTRLSQTLETINAKLYCPPLGLCTDNGAMIAYTGFLRMARGLYSTQNIDIRPRWSIDEI